MLVLMSASLFVSSPSPMDTLPPLERAVISTAVRLVSCTVTESLTRAIYIPVAPLGLDARALAVVLSSDASNKPPAVIASYRLEDILAVLPLKHVPIFKSNPYALEIGLLDPMDISPNIFVVDHGAANDRETEIDNVCPKASLVAHLLTRVLGNLSYSSDSPGPLKLWLGHPSLSLIPTSYKPT